MFVRGSQKKRRKSEDKINRQRAMDRKCEVQRVYLHKMETNQVHATDDEEEKNNQDIHTNKEQIGADEGDRGRN